jgi:ATP-binding cassette subfamily C protein
VIRDAGLLLGSSWRLSHGRLVLQVVLLVATGLIGGASLLLLVPIVNSVADSSVSVTLPVVGDLSLGDVPLPALLAGFVLLIAIQAGIAQASAVTTTRVQQALIDDLRQEAFAAVLAARWPFVLSRRRSDVISTITVGAVRAGMAYNQMLQVAVAAVLAVVSAAIAVALSPALGAIAIAGVAVIAIVQSLSIRPSYRLGVELGDRQRTVQSVVTDSLDSLRLVRAHSASGVWTTRLADAFAGTREAQVANVRRQSLVTGLTSVGTALAAAVLVLVAVALEVPPASLVVILVLVFRLAVSVRQGVGAAAAMANSLPAVRDLADLTTLARDAVEVPPEAATDRGPLADDPHLPLLAFSAVDYAYADGPSVVSGLTFEVPRGEMTALTGPSGVGKSTAVDLALGLLSPDAGTILVDGSPLLPADLPWWRTHVAYVPQETVLIPGTLHDNLIWSVSQERTDEECWRALDQAAARFARDLPDGLDTRLGDRGVRLSGGERQRVAIARALLRRPALLVLDEATSALDDGTEEEVLDLLSSLRPEVTVLVVAHRHSTIAVADHVVQLD